MWKNIVERRAMRSNGGRRLSEVAMSRSFQTVGEWWFQNKWETKRRARSTEGRVTAEERSMEVICDAHTLGQVCCSAKLSWFGEESRPMENDRHRRSLGGNGHSHQTKREKRERVRVFRGQWQCMGCLCLYIYIHR